MFFSILAAENGRFWRGLKGFQKRAADRPSAPCKAMRWPVLIHAVPLSARQKRRFCSRYMPKAGARTVFGRAGARSVRMSGAALCGFMIFATTLPATQSCRVRTCRCRPTARTPAKSNHRRLRTPRQRPARRGRRAGRKYYFQGHMVNGDVASHDPAYHGFCE